MITVKKQIQQLVALFKAKNISDIVISPGSRNGALTHSFVSDSFFNCRNIVDERSAAYFAMGLAQSLNRPVAIVCSSGTATLNYAPAVAESFYMKTPLIVLTADRPDYRIDQMESQCIRQEHIYQNFVKAEFSLPLGESADDLYLSEREINRCLNIAQEDSAGPVHFNVPVEEPLYDFIEGDLPKVRVIDSVRTENSLSESVKQELWKQLKSASRILILVGQYEPTDRLLVDLQELSKNRHVLVLGEHLANLPGAEFCTYMDTLIPLVNKSNPEQFNPDILITFGGQWVSKVMRQFLCKFPPKEHWAINPGGEVYDTFRALTKVLPVNPDYFFSQWVLECSAIFPEAYREKWMMLQQKMVAKRDTYLKTVPFSDLKVFAQIIPKIPTDTVVHWGNSSSVRYGLALNRPEDCIYLGNRGTSGIDGSLSTAVGYASVSSRLNLIILGDLSFFYDSNALWNHYINPDLRIIVINNHGGNIFGLIPGPDRSLAFGEHFITPHNCSAEGLAKTFGLDYCSVKEEKELDYSLLDEFFAKGKKQAAILEIYTNTQTNSDSYKGLFSLIKN